MPNLDDLVRGAGEDFATDWRDDRPRKPPPARTTTRILERSSKTREKQETPTDEMNKNVQKIQLNEVDMRVLEARAENRTLVYRSAVAQRKLYRRACKKENREANFVSAREAALFGKFEHNSRGWKSFQENSLPRPVIITPEGVHFRAERETRIFHTKGIRSVWLDQQGTCQVSSNHHQLKPGEQFIPKHHYAAWQVDGRMRGTPIADYVAIRDTNVSVTRSEDDTLTVKVSDEKPEDHPHHAAFVVENDRVVALKCETFRAKQVERSEAKLEQLGLLKDGRVTSKGLALLGKTSQKVPISPEDVVRFVGGQSPEPEGDWQGALRRARANRWITGPTGPDRDNLSLTPRGVAKLERMLQKEKEHHHTLERAELIGIAVGFYPRDCVPESTSGTREWDQRFKSDEVITRSGERIEVWRPRNAKHAGPKDAEVGHDLILAYALDAAIGDLQKSGSKDIEVVSERALRRQQTKSIQGTRKSKDGQDKEKLWDEKGIPDAVVRYTKKDGEKKEMAIEADSGGSSWSSSKGYDEATLAGKEAWADQRKMQMVFAVQSRARARCIRRIPKADRVVWVVSR